MPAPQGSLGQWRYVVGNRGKSNSSSCREKMMSIFSPHDCDKSYTLGRSYSLSDVA